jgi:NAD(P)H-flavin reductase
MAVWKQEVLFAEAPIASVEEEAENLFHLVIDISANPELRKGHRKAGQFVQMKVGGSKPSFLAIASPPQMAESGGLEFLIKYVDGSTAGLLCGLRKGDKVEVSQVMGNGFNLDKISPPEVYSTVFLFATGSGIRLALNPYSCEISVTSCGFIE